MSLSPELEAQYITIIDGILAVSDLNTISAKRIRNGVQAAVKHDVTPHKQALTDLILKRFDVASAKAEVNGDTTGSTTPDTDAGKPVTNGKRASPSDESSVRSPPPKKHKPQRSVQESDAVLAARLQAEENGKARSTRTGGVSKRKTPVKKDKSRKKKKRSKDKVDSDDDTDAASGPEKEEKEKKGGFHKPMILSAPLSTLLGETQLSRPQTVKKIWDYIKAHDLQDPSDKRQIICDENLRSVFRQDKVHMFTMNKILSQNLYAIDE